MKCLLGLLSLLACFAVTAKEKKFYQCPQADGSVVTQDRPCIVTDLFADHPKRKSNKNQLRQSRSNKPTTSQLNETSARRITQLKTRNGNRQPHQRSRFFESGLDPQLFAMYHVSEQRLSRFQRYTFTPKKLKQTVNASESLQLSIYPATHRNQGEGAFAVALTEYHKTRLNPNNTPLDSQFKSHKAFKVFNIEYRQKNRHKAKSEFYIDDINNDLFVFKIQAPEQKWPAYERLMAAIVGQL